MVSIIASDDYSDLLRAFNAEGVEYLVVGAHALAVYGYLRYTGDFDVWVRPSEENSKNVYRALTAFGAPVDQLSASDFASDDLIFQIGVEPIRIDIITSIDGVIFEEAWKNKVAADYGGIPIWILSRKDLLTNKKTVARPKDLEDVRALERLGEF